MSNPEAYISHQLNMSRSKEAHVFPKATRFINSSKINTEAIYNIPSTATQRTTTLGYGSKVNIALKSSSPPPGTYKFYSDFERKDYVNTTTIGESRDKITFGSFLLQALKKSKETPSPNKYNVSNTHQVVGGRIGQRIKTEPALKEKKMIPGPGSYKLDAIQMKDRGSYVLSSYKNVSSPRYFSISTIQKNKELSRSRANASVSYDIQEKQIGKYAASKYKNVISRTFGKSQRPGLVEKSKLSVPGFKYRRFSQFGGIQA